MDAPVPAGPPVETPAPLADASGTPPSATPPLAEAPQPVAGADPIVAAASPAPAPVLPPPVPRPPLSRLAVASLLFGIAGFFPFFGLAFYSLVRLFTR